MNYIVKFKNYLFLIAAIALIVFVGNYFTSDTVPQNENTFSIQKIIKGDISEKVLVTGRVESANYLPITTSVNGIVSKIYVKEGQKVVKGQKIMEIKLNNDGEIDYQNALNNYNSASISLAKAKSELRTKNSNLINSKYDYERIRDKSEDSTEYKNSFTTALNEYKSAQDAVKIQEETIKQAQISLNKSYLSLLAQSPIIVAPDNGIVANILFVEGLGIKNSLADRTSVSVASIKNEGKSIVSFTLSELDINKVAVGQKVNIIFSNGVVKNFTAEVAGIDRVGSVSNNLAQYSVIVRINEESDKILPNMKIDGEIIINEKLNVVLAPSSSIKNERGTNFVFLEDGTRKEVTLGISNGSQTEIPTGLNEGESVRVEALPTSGFLNTNSNPNIRVPGLFGR